MMQHFNAIACIDTYNLAVLILCMLGVARK